jgi:hypothetical protein
MDLKNLIENHTYLIRSSYSSDNVKSITVLIISDKAYKLRWNNDSNNNIEWRLKSFLDSEYYLIEDISDIIGNKPEELEDKFKKEFNEDFIGLPNRFYYNNNEINWHPHFFVEETCITCGGSGQIPDDKTTSCKKVCPVCKGSRKQSKRVDILLQ